MLLLVHLHEDCMLIEPHFVSNAYSKSRKMSNLPIEDHCIDSPPKNTNTDRCHGI